MIKFNNQINRKNDNLNGKAEAPLILERIIRTGIERISTIGGKGLREQILRNRTKSSIRAVHKDKNLNH